MVKRKAIDHLIKAAASITVYNGWDDESNEDPPVSLWTDAQKHLILACVCLVNCEIKNVIPDIQEIIRFTGFGGTMPAEYPENDMDYDRKRYIRYQQYNNLPGDISNIIMRILGVEMDVDPPSYTGSD